MEHHHFENRNDGEVERSFNHIHSSKHNSEVKQNRQQQYQQSRNQNSSNDRNAPPKKKSKQSSDIVNDQYEELLFEEIQDRLEALGLS